MPSIWRSRWYCISTARSTSDVATGIWFFLISSRSTASRASRSITSLLLVLELLAQRGLETVERVGLAGVLRELVVELGDILRARLEDR